MANNAWSKLKRAQEQFHAFLEERGIGHLHDAERSRWNRFAHFCLLVGKSFVRNRCPVRASALAYTTLLAIVPLLAVGVSITTGLLQSDQEKTSQTIYNLVEKAVAYVAPNLNLEVKPGETGTVEKISTFISTFIGNIRSGTLGVTGTVALVFVAIGLLRTIEAAFNDIWGGSSCRSWLASIVQYWAVITLGPLMVMVVLGLNLNAGSYFQSTMNTMESWAVVKLALRFLPVVVMSLGFALLYHLMPNTRVQPLAALIGGAVAGVLLHLNNYLGVHYASKAVTYNKIYGPLAIVPLFLVGLYFCWLILLFGAQVAYAFQNRRSYLERRKAESVNQCGREFVALRIMNRVAQSFLRGEASPNVSQLSTTLNVPTRLVSQILETLVQAKLLVPVLDQEARYSPARPLRDITAHDVLQALRAGQGVELETSDDDARADVRNELERIRQAEREIAQSISFDNLAAPDFKISARSL